MSVPRRTVLAAASAALLPWGALQAGDRQPQRGSLVLGGGGRPYDAELLDSFWQLGGGKQGRIVVVPTAHPDMDKPATIPRRIALTTGPWHKRGVKQVTVRHTRSRDEAEAAEFVRPLQDATGVWLSGGDQSRLLEAYRDTAFHRELLALLARGGVIGGSSAGTAVQSQVAIVGWRGEQPLVQPGFNFLPATVVDQHFLARGRQARLERVVKDQPALTGLGIDEFTTLIVQDASLRVVGRSTVSVYRADGERLKVREYRSGEKIEL